MNFVDAKIETFDRLGTKAIQTKIKCPFRHEEVLIVQGNISAINSKNHLDKRRAYL